MYMALREMWKSLWGVGGDDRGSNVQENISSFLVLQIEIVICEH